MGINDKWKAIRDQVEKVKAGDSLGVILLNDKSYSGEFISMGDDFLLMRTRSVAVNNPKGSKILTFPFSAIACIHFVDIDGGNYE